MSICRDTITQMRGVGKEKRKSPQSGLPRGFPVEGVKHV